MTSGATPGMNENTFEMETVLYKDLAEIYARLKHNAPKPTYSVKTVSETAVSWDEGAFQKMKNSLKDMDYKAAASRLNTLYA